MEHTPGQCCPLVFKLCAVKGMQILCCTSVSGLSYRETLLWKFGFYSVLCKYTRNTLNVFTHSEQHHFPQLVIKYKMYFSINSVIVDLSG